MDKNLEELFDALVAAERAAGEAARAREIALNAFERAQNKLVEAQNAADTARGRLMGAVRLTARET